MLVGDEVVSVANTIAPWCKQHLGYDVSFTFLSVSRAHQDQPVTLALQDPQDVQ